MSQLNCDIDMTVIPRIFRQFIPQLLHVIVLPVFFCLFALIYEPFGLRQFIGDDWYEVHVIIISCILLVSTILCRLLYYFLPLKLNYSLYAFWSIGEVFFASFFVALYLMEVLHKSAVYFSIVSFSFKFLLLTLVIPYIILALSMIIAEFRRKVNEPDEKELRMRFYDDKHNLKLVLQPSSVLYISAEINYVNIYYVDNDKVRNYILRSSMKALDEICQDNGLLRCHRSYYINPKHVKVLRKDKDGIVYAELDARDVMNIPVTKRYYDRLSDMLL